MDRITDFVDAFVPKNLPKKRKAALKEELSCHILDKKDYYQEIGFDENAGIDKAIADFGNSKEINSYVYREFEELYSERSVFGIMAFIIIAVMNALCFPLDLVVATVDYIDEPSPVSAFASSCFILLVLLMIAFARIKKYRKTLISIGVINTLIACSILFCLYPQMAAWTSCYNCFYLIDSFTPISMGRIIEGGKEFLSSVLSMVLPIVFALYCFTAALRIRKGKAKPIKRPVIKIAVFVALYLVFSLVSSLMLSVSSKYIEDYPVWFRIYWNYISEESQQKFDEIAIGDSYSDVSGRLNSEGYVTLDSYRNSLDRLKKKQFANALKEFDFADGYEIWFHSVKHVDGNGFVGLKQENGIITAKGIGNMEKNMYNNRYIYKEHILNFGYSEPCSYGIDDREDYKHDVDLKVVAEYFKALKKDAPEAEVMSRFGEEFGTIYTRRFSVEGVKEISYYRICCCEEFETEENLYGITGYEIESIYIELTFENGKLIKGAMYDEVTSEKTPTVTIEKLK